MVNIPTIGGYMKRSYGLGMIFSIIAITVTLACPAQDSVIPTFGNGPVHVRLYTDYFCPPCQSMETKIEGILKELITRNVITLTWVDVPFHQLTPLYARYYLYALPEKPSVEKALLVRNILRDAATRGGISSEKRLGALLKEKGISYVPHDVKPIFNAYNALMKEDEIDSTPTCVIVRQGVKEKVSGSVDIILALTQLIELSVLPSTRRTP